MSKVRSFKDELEFEQSITNYLEKHEAERYNFPPSVLGLAVYCDCCKDTIVEYSKLYSVPYKKFLTYIEWRKLNRLYTDPKTMIATMFDLKCNHGYIETNKLNVDANITSKTIICPPLGDINDD